MPQFSVLFNDEIGCQFKAKKGDSDDLDPLSELARFIRHFIDGYWDLTEQEISKTFIDLRRVGGSNKWFTKQEWKLKPKRLLAIYSSLKQTVMVDFHLSKFFKIGTSQRSVCIKNAKRQSRRYGKFLKLLKRYISNIGWRRYEYSELGNSQSKEMTENGVHVFYLPSCLNCQYDDRAYRNKYKAKDKQIENSVFTSQILTDQDLIEIFGEETHKKTN